VTLPDWVSRNDSQCFGTMYSRVLAKPRTMRVTRTVVVRRSVAIAAPVTIGSMPKSSPAHIFRSRVLHPSSFGGALQANRLGSQQRFDTNDPIGFHRSESPQASKSAGSLQRRRRCSSTLPRLTRDKTSIGRFGSVAVGPRRQPTPVSAERDLEAIAWGCGPPVQGWPLIRAPGSMRCGLGKLLGGLNGFLPSRARSLVRRRLGSKMRFS
jgi:hypothetical protein